MNKSWKLDIENLNGGYSDGVITKSATQFNRFKMAFPDEELTKTQKDRLNLMISLIERGILDIKIAVLN